MTLLMPSVREPQNQTGLSHHCLFLTRRVTPATLPARVHPVPGRLPLVLDTPVLVPDLLYCTGDPPPMNPVPPPHTLKIPHNLHSLDPELCFVALDHPLLSPVAPNSYSYPLKES